ncbi:hypothetical protein WJX72_004234 [[Myrmecia] bisecta]|uniref:NmrA-like domain-containing protein n=1 Tax=[Myrmecia] bisecta TaxID=41462 RepID=A0AAW1QQC2_9CHLO
MAGKQTIVVIGATGAQGGGVVDGLLKANKFIVKGEHLRQSGVPHTLLLTCFFFENFLKQPYLKYLDGSYGYMCNFKPDTAMPAHAVGDIGVTAAVIFSNPSKYVGKTVTVACERFKLPDALKIMSEVTGKRFNVDGPDLP